MESALIRLPGGAPPAPSGRHVADLDLRSGQLVQPDLFVGGLIDGRQPIEWTEFRIPILIAEVWSPGGHQPAIVQASLRWAPPGTDTALTIDLPGYFREVWAK